MKLVETACIPVIKMYRSNNSEIAKEADISAKKLEEYLNNGFRIICCSSTTFNEAVVVDYVLEKPVDTVQKDFHTLKDCIDAAIKALYSGGSDSDMMDKCEEVLRNGLEAVNG